ncbi:hypothetical protein CXG81DRAFT_19477 [Caulochytrium protostelioides]|uniref:Uncharacterized protein n=1 Tax=Caulochytrium protostelioides TaxID=1555241 RepID=A0A4P9X617_9FUNG|nr:hypothetical protein CAUPRSCDRAFT_10620 [Caulochytrium protostelioides]RKP00598.1 hypothetical protein CXG81DRAFT_19477 [Caulochytrium protostelioides]|eukprot:RKP00598.1 hypothetical protein CXG81DRAFT_19477 [Caulochytrium protostelioides]
MLLVTLAFGWLACLFPHIAAVLAADEHIMLTSPESLVETAKTITPEQYKDADDHFTHAFRMAMSADHIKMMVANGASQPGLQHPSVDPAIVQRNIDGVFHELTRGDFIKEVRAEMFSSIQPAVKSEVKRSLAQFKWTSDTQVKAEDGFKSMVKEKIVMRVHAARRAANEAAAHHDVAAASAAPLPAVPPVPHRFMRRQDAAASNLATAPATAPADIIDAAPTPAPAPTITPASFSASAPLPEAELIGSVANAPSAVDPTVGSSPGVPSDAAVSAALPSNPVPMIPGGPPATGASDATGAAVASSAGGASPVDGAAPDKVDWDSINVNEGPVAVDPDAAPEKALEKPKEESLGWYIARNFYEWMIASTIIGVIFSVLQSFLLDAVPVGMTWKGQLLRAAGEGFRMSLQLGAVALICVVAFHIFVKRYMRRMQSGMSADPIDYDINDDSRVPIDAFASPEDTDVPVINS